MIVYGVGASPFVRKVLVAAAEKGLAVEHVPLLFHSPDPAFRACSPLGKIPAFRDGDVRLADSSAICAYLERKHPAPPLVPDDAEGIARVVWFDKFAGAELFGPIGTIFFELFFKPKRLGQAPDVQAADAAQEHGLPPLCDYLEGQLDGEFLVGGRLTLADIAVASPFVNLHMVGRGVDASRWPRLAAFVGRITAREAFQRAGERALAVA